MAGRRVSVVMSKLTKKQRATFDFVDHAVLVFDAPRPETRQRVLQRLGFAHPGKRVTLHLIDQLVDPFNDFRVSLWPVQIVFPGVVSKNQLHFASFLATPFPAVSCAAAESKRLAFAGLRNKYAVSSSA